MLHNEGAALFGTFQCIEQALLCDGSSACSSIGLVATVSRTSDRYLDLIITCPYDEVALVLTLLEECSVLLRMLCESTHDFRIYLTIIITKFFESLPIYNLILIRVTLKFG